MIITAASPLREVFTSPPISIIDMGPETPWIPDDVDAHDHSPGRGRSVGAYAGPKISDEEVFQAKLWELERFRAPTSDFDYKLGALEHTKDRFTYELEMMS